MNLKKFLALVLAMAMALCAVSFAESAAPSDEALDLPVVNDVMMSDATDAPAEAAAETAAAEATAEPAGTEAPAEEGDLDLSELLDEEILADEFITVEDYAETENLPDDWWNILLLGTDNRYESNTYGRTDSMIILSVNLATHEAKLTSLMRDTWVSMYGRSSKAKLNAACVYGGPELTMRTINENFGMNISDYALINITGLADVIDVLGGIDIDVTEEERVALNRGLFDLSSQSGMEELEESGENVHLNGNQAVAFARIRRIDSDYQRTERQRNVLTAIATKLQESNDAVTIIGVVTSLLPYVETNLDLSELMTLAYVGLQLDMSSIEQLRLPADGTFDSGTYDGVWSIRPNFSENQQILYDFIYGSDE